MSEMQDRVKLALRTFRNATTEIQAREVLKAMRELPAEPGPRYSAGEYSRRNHEAMIDDALT